MVPSASDLIFVALLGLLTFTSLSAVLGDAGIGWHIRTGQLILATHTIPASILFVDRFIDTTGQAWYAWEWLYDVVAGWLDRAAGLNAGAAHSSDYRGLFAWHSACCCGP